jgi:hypothetical protein
MIAILHSLGMLIIDLFKSRRLAGRGEPVSSPSAQHRLEARPKQQ